MIKLEYLQTMSPLYKALAMTQKDCKRQSKKVNALRSSYIKEQEPSRATRILEVRSQALDLLHEYRQKQIDLTTSLFPDYLPCL